MTSRSTKTIGGKSSLGKGASVQAGESSANASKLSSSSAIGFEHLSFVFRVEPLDPNFNVQAGGQPRNHNSQGLWDPPKIRTAYRAHPGVLYRWSGGSVSAISANEQMQHQDLEVFGAATVFTHWPDSDHLLAVNFDARRRTVATNGGWRPLSFEHQGTGSPNRIRAFVNPYATKRQLPAPCPNLVPDILPRGYGWQPPANQNGHSPTSTSPSAFAGLVGKLPILIAIAAFSCPRAHVPQVLTTSIRPHSWQQHHHGNGRNIQHRGVVITIFLDPMNGQRSTRPNLERLENGDFGCFYR